MEIDRGRILNDYIEGNKKQFVIPVYQRNYEWSEDNCEKLFEDIVNASKNDTYHFCGSIVTKFLNDKKNIMSYVIIDGQQRLTTIYILLKALLDCSEKEKDKDILNDVLFNSDKYDEYAIDTQSKLKLKPIKTDNEQLNLLMLNNFDEINKKSGIWKNYEVFKKLILNELSKGLEIRNIYDGIKKLTCAQIKLDAEDSPQEIFDRINSTGVPLSLPDKIRNLVLMTDENQEALFEKYWLPIEEKLSTQELKDFCIDYINYISTSQIKESDAYDEFKDYCSQKNHSNEEILEQLSNYARLYHNFLYADCKSYSETTNYYLDCLQKIKQTTIFMFLFSLFTDYENEEGNLDDYELNRILHFLLGYSLKRGICEVGSNSLRGLYRTLYSRVFINPENKNHYYDSIVSFFEQLNTKDAIPSNERFKLDLVEKNLYPKKDLCKYLLTTLENDTVDKKTGLLKKKKEQISTSSLSIEHVMPQNKELSNNWREMLGENWQFIHDKYLHTLGNLTITGYNSELGDKPFSDKQSMMEDSDAKAVFLNKEILEKNTWNEQTIIERAERLSSEVLKLYSYDKPEVIVSFADPDYHEYSCEDETLAKNKKPNYFVFQGERVNVSSFAEMKELLIEKLYALNPNIIERMAEIDERIFDGAEYSLFSYNPKMVKSGEELVIKNTNIYESRGHSARRIIMIIQKLLNKYDIDQSDFIYSAKNTKPLGEGSEFIDWLKKKEKEGLIIPNYEKCSRTYSRFTTKRMSEYITDDENDSDWGTKNHYFYELYLAGSKCRLKLSFNSTGLSRKNLERIIKINDISLGKTLKNNWIWRTVFSTKSVDLEDLSNEQIDRVLDDFYSEMIEYEDSLFEKINH